MKIFSFQMVWKVKVSWTKTQWPKTQAENFFSQMLYYLVNMVSYTLWLDVQTPFLQLFCIPSPTSSRCDYSSVPGFTVSWLFLSLSFLPEGQGFVSEDEYLEISDIKRDQSGEYECSALNDVAAPDVRKVKITVNCELTHCQEVSGKKRT